MVNYNIVICAATNIYRYFNLCAGQPVAAIDNNNTKTLLLSTTPSRNFDVCIEWFSCVNIVIIIITIILEL